MAFSSEMTQAGDELTGGYNRKESEINLLKVSVLLSCLRAYEAGVSLTYANRTLSLRTFGLKIVTVNN